MKTTLLVAATFLVVASTAPQYGNVEEGPAIQPLRTLDSESNIRCKIEQITVWDTTYEETQEKICTSVYLNQCQTLYREQCHPTTKEVCQTNNEHQCTTDNREKCHDEFKTEYETYVETECTTSYKEDCEYHWEGTGNDKTWVPDRSTCKNNPYNHCEDVEKRHEIQVPHSVCSQVPVKNCVNVPVTNCEQVPDEECTKEPYEKCDQVPQEQCTVEHKRIPHRVSRTVPKKVCEEFNKEKSIEDISEEDLDSQVELVTERSNTKSKIKSDDAIVFSD